jgi:hypothetical protein
VCAHPAAKTFLRPRWEPMAQWIGTFTMPRQTA